MPLSLIVECVVAVLLVITIGYCWRLNERLKRLRADEASLRATISELITATEIAERAIMGLKSTAGSADKTLGARLGEAEAVSQKLSSQLGLGEDVLDRIGRVADGAAKSQPAETRKVVREPQRQVREPAAPKASPAQISRHTETHSDDGRGHRAHDISKAAQESASRLQQFRRRAQERVA